MAAGYAYGAMAGYEIISGFQQAEMVRENAKLSREVSDMNADAADLDAYHAVQKGISQEARYQTVIDQTLGEQKVAYAAQGVDATFGTAAEVQSETKLTGQLNQMDIKAKAQAEALGFKNQASNIRLQSRLSELQTNVQASSIQNASIMNAASTGLSGYSKGRVKPSLAEIAD